MKIKMKLKLKFENRTKRIVLAMFVGIMTISLASGYINAAAADNIANKVTIVPRGGSDGTGSFSDKDGFWYPGRTLTKDFTIKNSNSDKVELDKIFVKIQSVDNSIINKIFNPDEEIYKEFMKNLTVKVKDSDTVLFEGTFGDFSNKNASLREPIIIPAKGEKDISLSLHFSEQAGNMFQNLQSFFNLSIVYTLKNGGSTGGDVTHLPQTGGLVNTITLTVLGIIVAGTGLMLFYYKPCIIRKITSKKGGHRIV